MTEREARRYLEIYLEREPYAPLARAIRIVLRLEDARRRAERAKERVTK